MKIAYVGDFINHGKSLQTIGTSTVILLSHLENVDCIDVLCPNVNKNIEEFELPPKVRLHEFYRYGNSNSIIRLLKVQWKKYDIVIFNMLPTGFGDGTMANVTALFIPILLVKFFRLKNIRLIYHNSVFTNDVKTLGYNSALDKIRSFFLSIVEKGLFKNLDTFVLLDIYKKRIDSAIGKNRIRVLKPRYFEAVTSAYINQIMNIEYLKFKKSDNITVLMHGSWGPQKNIELGLSALKKIKEKGAKFTLIVSGGFNHHFPDYEKKFLELLHSYSDIIYEYLGSVTEKDIVKIFLNADLLLLPYNAPGGHSGVLEQSIFFEVPTIAIDFPEFREQASESANVKLVNRESFDSILEALIGSVRDVRKIAIKEKIMTALANVKHLIEPATEE